MIIRNIYVDKDKIDLDITIDKKNISLWFMISYIYYIILHILPFITYFKIIIRHKNIVMS